MYNHFMMENFYITTAIDYVNGAPHIGHAYEKIYTDILFRHFKKRINNCYFLTGTDEHGIKIQKTAKAAGITPKELCDINAAQFKEAWKLLDIDYSKFIRTTDDYHQKTVQDIFEKLLPPDCIKDGKVYRSVHYIIKYKGVYLEIQVRTLFEEGWGEVDHAIVYPYFQDDQILKKYTELLNRLSGLADEMSSFFYLLKALEIEHLKQSGLTNDTTSTITYKDSGFEIPDSQEKKQNEDRPLNTPNDYLKSVLEE